MISITAIELSLKRDDLSQQAQDRMTQRAVFGAAATAYLLLALLYLVRVPIGRQPDELSHMEYIAFIANEKSFPVFQGREKGIYEAHQPPLYYLVCAPTYGVLHRFSHEAPILAARFVSWLAGTGIVWLTFLIAQSMFPGRHLAQLSTTVLVAVLPIHLNISASVGNDALAGLFSTLILTALLTGTPRWSQWRRSVLLGALIGLSLLTKSGTVFLLPLTLVAFLLKEGTRAAGLKTAIGQFGIVLVVCLLVCGWWLVRNVNLYGDPFAIRAFNEGFAGSPHPSYFLDRGMSLESYVLMVAQLTFMTFWGIFGEVNQSITRLGQMYATGQGVGVYLLLVTVFLVVTACPCVGLATYLRSLLPGRKTRGNWTAELGKRPTVPIGSVVILAVGVLLAVAQYVQFNLIYFQAQARYLHPMLPAISCLAALGSPKSRTGDSSAWWLALLITGLLLSSALNLTVWLTQPTLPLPY